MAGFTTPPVLPPTPGHTGSGDAAPTGTADAKRATVYDDPAFAAFFCAYCQGTYEVPYLPPTGI
jgi:hypothetical protein